MKLNCPNCGVKGTADDSYAGKKVRCPKCQEMFLANPETSIEEIDSTPVDVPPVVVEPPKVKLPVQSVVKTKEELPAESDLSLQEEDDPLSEDEEKEEIIDWSDLVSEMEQQEEKVALSDEFDTEGPPAISSDDEELPPGRISTDEEDDELLEGSIPAEEELVTLAEQSVLEDSPTISFGDDGPEKNLDEEVDVAEPSGFLSKEAGDDQVVADSSTDESLQSQESEQIEDRPYGLDGQQCWQCGKNDSGEEPFIAKDGRLYCAECLEKEDTQDAEPSEDRSSVPPSYDAAAQDNPSYGFTVFGAIREAWEKTKGVKGAIWMGSAVMYLVVLVLAAGGAWLLPSFDPNVPNFGVLAGNIVFQVLVDSISVLFIAGLLVVGIRHVVGKPVSWNMVFDGFPLAAKIVVAYLLQFIMICIGFLLLVLPGIYLSVGYALTIPLIVDQQLSPWQAMERSRKAVHKVWWKVAGLFLIMGFIMVVSMIPLGLGLIWTWPMFIVLAGVLYRYLFGRANFSG